MYYTIGQRRGLNIGGTKDRTFVVKKDLDKNILYVAVGDDNKYLYSSTAIIEEFNYLTDKRPSKCTCKFRYRQSDIDINVKYLDTIIYYLVIKDLRQLLLGNSVFYMIKIYV